MIYINLLQKVCSKCVKSKGIKKFYRARSARYKDGFGPWCLECRRQYQRKHRPAYYTTNREKCNANVRATTKRLRDAVIDMYGGKCSCPHCEETTKNFLSLEHVRGGGGEHRRSVNRYTLWRTILRAGVHSDRYAVLCYNCNLSRGFYGYCHDSSAPSQLYASNTAVDHML